MIYEKQSVRNLVNYQTRDIPYRVKLDANESNVQLFQEGLNLSSIPLHVYPDDQATAFREKLSKILHLPSDMITEGNGSSELIELLIKTCIDTNEVILAFEPTFSMYRIYGQIYGAKYVGIQSNDDFSLDVKRMIDGINTYAPKIIFLCSPNNPTGYQMKRKDILEIAKASEGLVVVDEAYIEFADQKESVIFDVNSLKNLVVLRTFSKAFGLASIRHGYMMAPKEISDSIRKVKSPYHLNALTQAVGILALDRLDQVKRWVNSVILEREKMMADLQRFGIKTYPAFGNFLWVRSEIAEFGKLLEDKGILIRAYGKEWKGYYRITIGTPEENKVFLHALKEIVHG